MAVQIKLFGILLELWRLHETRQPGIAIHFWSLFGKQTLKVSPVVGLSLTPSRGAGNFGQSPDAQRREVRRPELQPLNAPFPQACSHCPDLPGGHFPQQPKRVLAVELSQLAV